MKQVKIYLRLATYKWMHGLKKKEVYEYVEVVHDKIKYLQPIDFDPKIPPEASRHIAGFEEYKLKSIRDIDHFLALLVDDERIPWKTFEWLLDILGEIAQRERNKNAIKKANPKK